MKPWRAIDTLGIIAAALTRKSVEAGFPPLAWQRYTLDQFLSLVGEAN